MPRDERHRKSQHDWYLRNKDRIIKKRRHTRHRMRQAVLKLLGGVCINCGCDLKEAIEINHKYGNGTQDRKKSGRQKLYRDILDGTRTDEFELTCKVCNAEHYLRAILKLPGNWCIKYSPE